MKKSEEDRVKDFLAEARERYNVAAAAHADSRENELEDLKFLAGSPDNQWQWPDEVLQTRNAEHGGLPSSRPCLTINKLPQHVNQVTNDQKANRPAGTIIPVSGDASKEVADVFGGMVRYIEYISDADVAYDTACQNQVTYGEGYFTIYTDYVDDVSFNQEIKIGRIRNSFSVLMDPAIQDPCGSDAEYVFVEYTISNDAFERLYPDAQSQASIELSGVGQADLSKWFVDGGVRIAGYFYAVYEPKTLLRFDNGEIAEEGSLIANQLKQGGYSVVDKRIAQNRKIKWAKINGYEILEEREWAGKWIPIIRVIGNEFEIDGELHISGLVRNAKDPQRMYNYWASQEAEMLALAPKAPFVGYSGQFEGFEDRWATANTIPWPYLEVNSEAVDGNGQSFQLPQRSQPPMAPAGLIAAKMAAADDIKAVTGQYDSSLGQTSNERSGKAILARERQSDTGTYHYVDNLVRAIRYATRQIVDLIPKIYDTKRIAMIMGEDGEPSQVPLDPNQPEATREIRDNRGEIIQRIYNPNVGRYDVRVIAGPSYTTKRQEAAESMSKLLQTNPDLWGLIGDLAVTEMDWPNARKVAERLKRAVDPALLDEGENPELQQANQQIEQMGQQMQQMQDMLNNIQQSFEAQEIRIKAFDAETKRISTMQSGMTPQQIQDTIAGMLQGMLSSSDLNPPQEVQLPQQDQTMQPGPQNPPALMNNNPPE